MNNWEALISYETIIYGQLANNGQDNTFLLHQVKKNGSQQIIYVWHCSFF